jgi:DNA-binding transcriptional MerR regulator
MQLKTTRAFRTISEAGDELGLQPHVLRFWESKFPQIKPMKRGGGRRFYRPEDIEFLRGIKILLHDEKHPIKDVQKLIRVKGAGRILELGRSVERASKPKAVEEVELIPERIVNYEPARPGNDTDIDTAAHNDVGGDDVDDEILRPISAPPMPIAKANMPASVRLAPVVHSVELEGGDFVPPLETQDEDEDESNFEASDDLSGETVDARTEHGPNLDQDALREALSRLKQLRGKWTEFQAKA